MKKFIKEYDKAPQAMNINALWHTVKHYGLPIKPEWKKSRKAFFKAVKGIKDEVKVKAILDDYNKKPEFCTVKQDMAEEIKKAIASYNEEVRLAKEQAFKDLGEDKKEFNLALSFFQNLNNQALLGPEDYSHMTSLWELIRLCKDGHNLENGSLIEVATALTQYLGVQIADVSSMNDEQLRVYISNLILSYTNAIEASDLTKEQHSIIKMDMDAVGYESLEDDNAVGTFHSKDCLDIEKAVDLKGKGKEVLMYEVDTAESGISRILLGEQRDIITVYVGHQITEFMHEDADRIKELMFRNGIKDADTGKVYFPVLRSASSERQANMTFVSVDAKLAHTPATKQEYIDLGVPNHGWQEALEIWCQVTGCDSWTQFERTFMKTNAKGEKVVNMSKILARVAIRSSNSLASTNTKINQELNEELKQIKICNTGDVERYITRDYMTIAEPGSGRVEYINGADRPRKIVCSDGQMVCSIEVAALLSAMVGANGFSINDYRKFNLLWDACGKDTRNVKKGSDLYHLIMTMSHIFQVRHEGKKGIIVSYNLERFKETKDYGLIVPESAQKFTSGKSWGEFPLEICNWLKKKKPLVNLNTQFISALKFDDPESLKIIAKHWVNYMNESFENPVKMLEFHHLTHNFEGHEANVEDDGILSTVLRTNHYFDDERYILKLREKQYRKFLKDMKCGKLLVPGMYTYMVADPAFFIENVFGVKTNHLGEGEFYHNGKNCYAGLFRAPMAHKTEAQKVELINHKEYWYMKDCIVFNGYDGVWDRMAGADFDGDMCAVIPEDSEHGKLIVDAIVVTTWDVWEPAQNAKETVFNFENLLNHLVKTSRKSRVGELANYVFRLMEIHNHLLSLAYYARKAGVNWVLLKNPADYAKGECFGWVARPSIKQDPNGVSYLEARGFAKFRFKKGCSGVYCSMTKPILKLHKDWKDNIAGINPDHVWFDDSDKYTGWFTPDQLENLANSIDDITKIGKILESREIDGAKTGVYAEGAKFAETRDEADSDYTDKIKTKLTSHCILGRLKELGKKVMDEDRLNQYISISPYGLMYDYVCTEENRLMNEFNSKGMSKTHYLSTLLTDDEYNALFYAVDQNGKILLDLVRERKKAYNDSLYAIRQALSNTNVGGEDKEDDIASKIKTRKKEEMDFLIGLTNRYNDITMPTIVMAMYIASYEKTDNQSNGLSYAWLFAEDMVSLLSRDNASISVVPIRKKGLTRCFVDNGFLYVCYNVNDEEKVEKHTKILNAVSGICPLFVCNGKVCASVRLGDGQSHHEALLTRNNEVAKGDGTLRYENILASINACGFQFHNNTAENWKNIVASNNGYFDIMFDKNKNLVMSVHGKTIATVAAGCEVPRSFYNRAVRMRNNEVAVGYYNNQPLPTTQDTNGYIKGILVTPVSGVLATPLQ